MLTSIESVNPVYCYIDVNEHAILKYQRLAVAKKRVSARDARIPAYMALANDEERFPHEGVIDFVDNKIDPGTGTLRGRGVFPNKSGLLLPGFFARLRLPGSGKYQAMLIPDVAIGTDQDKKLVLVVKPDDTVEVRPVTLGALFGKLRAIEDGVTETDRVIVNGTQLARPGSKVAAVEKPIPTDLLRLLTPDLPDMQALPSTGPATGPGTTPGPAETRPSDATSTTAPAADGGAR